MIILYIYATIGIIIWIATLSWHPSLSEWLASGIICAVAWLPILAAMLIVIISDRVHNKYSN